MGRMNPLVKRTARPNLPSMLRLKQIRLTQFKNHPDTTYDLDARVVGITGSNGVGKTNLLDALYALCFSRGYFSRSDQTLVKHGNSGFRIDGTFQRLDQLHQVGLILRETGKKEVWLDGDPLPRIADHLGRFPVVMIAPDDAELITGDSKPRRLFLDALISQLRPGYMTALSKYNRVLQQRQALLRECAEVGLSAARTSLLDVLDEQWAELAGVIVEARLHWCALLNQQMIQQHRSIAGTTDQVQMFFQHDLAEGDPLSMIRKQRSKDIAAQRNTLGPHRDDLLFTLDQHPFKQVASQGQRKTLLFSLKLAERALLEENLGIPPLLLLDDVFEKLDPDRIRSLLSEVVTQTTSQIFITDTDSKRLNEQLNPLPVDWKGLGIDRH